MWLLFIYLKLFIYFIKILILENIQCVFFYLMCIFIVYVINIIMFEYFVHRLSECYFANKGSAALLCSPKLHHQQQHQQQPRRKRHHHHSHPHRHQSLSAPASSRLSASEDEMQSRANDIQAHLQSMFHILRPDDSLNMVCL